MHRIDHIFIIVPSASLTSPVRGAIALANALCHERDVTLVSLKQNTSAFELLDTTVNRISLFRYGSWPARLFSLRKLLKEAGGNRSVASISLGLSADYCNSWCRNLAVTCSSVRANLPQLYPETYGKVGKWIAHRHLHQLRRLDHVVSMTQAMSEQVQLHIGRTSPVIGNFVDETHLSAFRCPSHSNGPLRFVFTGSMLRGKQPHLVLQALQTLQKRGIDARLDAFGEGPLLQNLRQQAANILIPGSACFHGFIQEPYSAVAMADTLVLPSLTEGVSRSALEALFLGVPCVLRDIDGNAELIKPGINGNLFRKDEELADVMLKTAEWSRRENPNHGCLTPSQFRQREASQKLIELLET